MWPNPQFPADLVTFTEEIVNGKLHFLCSAGFSPAQQTCFAGEFSKLGPSKCKNEVSSTLISNSLSYYLKAVTGFVLFYSSSKHCYVVLFLLLRKMHFYLRTYLLSACLFISFLPSLLTHLSLIPYIFKRFLEISSKPPL